MPWLEERSNVASSFPWLGGQTDSSILALLLCRHNLWLIDLLRCIYSKPVILLVCCMHFSIPILRRPYSSKVESSTTNQNYL